MTPMAGRGRWLVVAGLLALAALVRVSTMFYESLSGDDATVALIAKHILTGENFPAFFYRQTFMGTLNGAHLVPALAVFGPSVLLVRLNSIAWSLLFPLGLYVLGRRIFDEATARLTLLLAAVPPFLLTYWSTVAEPHFETNILGVYLLLLALAALTAPTEPRRTRALLCFGFLAGLACWTSVKIVVVLAPALLALVVRDPRLPVRRGGLVLAASFLVGSLPAWLFYLTHPDPGQGNLASAQRFLDITIDLSPVRIGAFLREMLPLPIGTYYWSRRAPHRAAAFWGAASIYAAAILVVGVDAVRRLRAGGPAAWGRWLLLALLVTPFAALYGSEFSERGGGARARYVLPVYIPLLLVTAAAVVRLGRRSRVLAGLVLAYLLAFNVWTNLAFMWPLSPSERARRAAEIEGRQALLAHLARRPVDGLYVDGVFGSLIWQFLQDWIPVSGSTIEVYVPSGLRVDAARRVAILDEGPGGMVARQLAQLGVQPRVSRFGRLRLYEDVRAPVRSLRRVEPAGWRVAGDPGLPPAIADGDVGTMWPPEFTADPDVEILLDLGVSRPLARLVYWPALPGDLVIPLDITGSEDGERWEKLGTVPVRRGRPAFTVGERVLFRSRNAWLELDLPARPVRYLRLRSVAAEAGAGWGVTELQLYEADPSGAPPSVPADVTALVDRLRADGVTRLFADPVVSARVALTTGGAIETALANGVLNNHGYSPPSYFYMLPRLRVGDALLVAPGDASAARARLEAAGVPFAADRVPEGVLFRLTGALPTSTRCRPTDWRVAGEAEEAGGAATRYVVEARLREPHRVAAVRLEHPGVTTRHVEIASVAASDDGRAWRPLPEARRVPEWAWAGRTVFTFSGGATEVALGGIAVRHLRVEARLPFHGSNPVRTLCVRPVDVP